MITENEPLRVLQITDTHADVSEDANERTRADIRAIVERTNPHLLALTGDLWCGDLNPTAAPMWRQRELQFFVSLGKPWALCLGNHDYAPDLGRLWSELSTLPYSLTGAPTVPGNAWVPWKNTEGHPLWDIFFIHSGQYWELPEAMEWLITEAQQLESLRGHRVPALLFFHIPLANYREAVQRNRYHGEAHEEVQCWGDEEGKGPQLLYDLPMVRGAFCGHDHTNDFWFEDCGIIFGYGRVSGYGGYGTPQFRPGAKEIVLDPQGSWMKVATVFADGTRWGESHIPLPPRGT